MGTQSVRRRGRVRGSALLHAVGVMVAPVLAPVCATLALVAFDPGVERFNPHKLLFPVLFFSTLTCWGLVPELVLANTGLRTVARRVCAAVALPLAVLGLWMLLVPGLCMRLHPPSARPVLYDTVVERRGEGALGPAWVEVRDGQGRVHRLTLGERAPGPGRELVFTARQGMFGVLYDIRYVHGLRRDAPLE